MFLIMFSMYTLNSLLYLLLYVFLNLLYPCFGINVVKDVHCFTMISYFMNIGSNIICIDLLATIISILKYIVNVKMVFMDIS